MVPKKPTSKASPSNTIEKKVSKPKKFKRMTRKEANALVIDSTIAIQEAVEQLDKARELAAKAGLSVDCTTLPKTTISNAVADGFSNASDSIPLTAVDPATVIPMTTGGHSNTDHSIVRTGDERTDRIAELRRNMWRRHRRMAPEARQEGRWDKPRLPGERRRRIVRERDFPDAPREPPLSGYIAFLGQMTVKIRHDRPNTPHDQSKVMQEVSKLWRVGLSEEEKQYYNRFVVEARDEYECQMIEYRATGTFTENKEFYKLPHANVWVRKPSKRNGLEQEICSYETLTFPPRPPSMDEAYNERQERSVLRRKLRVKGLENPDGTLKDGLDFEVLFQEYKEDKMQKKKGEMKDDEAEDDANAEELVWQSIPV